jgi:hypothetical protein
LLFSQVPVKAKIKRTANGVLCNTVWTSERVSLLSDNICFHRYILEVISFMSPKTNSCEWITRSGTFGKLITVHESASSKHKKSKMDLKKLLPLLYISNTQCLLHFTKWWINYVQTPVVI